MWRQTNANASLVTLESRVKQVRKENLKARLYRARSRSRTRTQPFRLSARLSAGNLHVPPFIQDAVIRAVTVAMSAATHHLMKMAANASDTDCDEILAFYLFTWSRRRRRKRRYRRISVHPILQKRHIYGKYHHLVKELHFHLYKFRRVKLGPSSTKTQEIVRATIS